MVASRLSATAASAAASGAVEGGELVDDGGLEFVARDSFPVAAFTTELLSARHTTVTAQSIGCAARRPSSSTVKHGYDHARDQEELREGRRRRGPGRCEAGAAH